MGASILRSLIVIAAIEAATAAFRANGARGAEAGLTLVLAGRVDRVVAAGAGVAVLRDGAVSLLDGDGRVVARCGGAAATARRAPRSDRTALSAEEILNEAALSDEDGSPEAEELLEDEGLEPSRRGPPIQTSAGAPRALDVAGAPAAAWIGTVEGLWRLATNGSGCARAGLGAAAITRVAVAGATVVAIADATVWRSDDAGATFGVAGVLTSPARGLALADDGTPFVADDDGVVEVLASPGSGGPLPRVLERPVDALVACGPDVTVLADDGTYRLSRDGVVTPLGPRPPARAIACAAADGSRVLAAGVGLWSTGSGATWNEETVGLGRSFGSVAWAAGKGWLAAQDGVDEGLDDGLFVTGRTGASPEPAPPSAPRRASPPARKPRLWAALLPRVAVAFDGWTESTGVQGWRLWLLVTFTLNRYEVRSATRQLEDYR